MMTNVYSHLIRGMVAIRTLGRHLWPQTGSPPPAANAENPGKMYYYDPSIIDLPAKITVISDETAVEIDRTGKCVPAVVRVPDAPDTFRVHPEIVFGNFNHRSGDLGWLRKRIIWKEAL